MFFDKKFWRPIIELTTDRWPLCKSASYPRYSRSEKHRVMKKNATSQRISCGSRESSMRAWFALVSRKLKVADWSFVNVLKSSWFHWIQQWGIGNLIGEKARLERQKLNELYQSSSQKKIGRARRERVNETEREKERDRNSVIAKLFKPVAAEIFYIRREKLSCDLIIE